MSEIPSDSKALVTSEEKVGEERDQAEQREGGGELTEQDHAPEIADATVIKFPALRERFGRKNWLGTEWL